MAAVKKQPEHSPEPPRANAIATATGRSWADWVTWLQNAGADQLQHTALAELILTELYAGHFEHLTNKEWWAQGVAISYEQFMGRRVPGQRSDGSFEATASKTVPLPRAQVWAMVQSHFGDLKEFFGASLQDQRTSSTEKRDYWRATCGPDIKLQVAIEAKDEAKTLVTGTSANLIGPQARQEHKQAWQRIFTEVFTGEKPTG